MKKIALSLLFALSLCSQAFAADAPAVGDDEIVAKVQAALKAEPSLKGLELNVSCKNGEVTLAGQPEDGQQLYQAAIAAQQVTGVKAVKNEMYPKN